MADGLLHMFCRFHSAKLLFQKPSSVLASALMVSLWNQDFWWFSKAYKLLAINLATGPKVIDMEIILPTCTILAIYFAGIASSPVWQPGYFSMLLSCGQGLTLSLGTNPC